MLASRAEAAALLASGMTSRAAARKLGVPEQTVGRWCRGQRAALIRARRALIAEARSRGIPTATIAERIGCSVSLVKHVPPRRAVPPRISERIEAGLVARERSLACRFDPTPESEIPGWADFLNPYE